MPEPEVLVAEIVEDLHDELEAFQVIVQAYEWLISRQSRVGILQCPLDSRDSGIPIPATFSRQFD